MGREFVETVVNRASELAPNTRSGREACPLTRREQNGNDEVVFLDLGRFEGEKLGGV